MEEISSVERRKCKGPSLESWGTPDSIAKIGRARIIKERR